MLAQEIYDTVVKHLFAQGKPAYGHIVLHENDDGVMACAYRMGELKCAVGCLIPDDAYRDSMERKSIQAIIAEEDYGLPLYLGGNVTLLRQLQSAHDNRRHWQDNDYRKGWNYAVLAEELRGVAKQFELQTDTLTLELIKHLQTTQEELIKHLHTTQEEI